MLVLLAACPPAAAGERDFARFWAAFRSAVLADDREALVAMSRLPFTLHGQLDEDADEKVDAAGLQRQLPDLLLQDTGLSAEPQPMLELVERTKQPARPARGAKTVRVGQFEFALRPDGWRFAGAYVDR